MTNKEAIKEIQRWLDGCPFTDTKEAFEMAIKALRRIDCIYVKDECYFSCGESGTCEAEEEGETDGEQ